MSAKSSHHTGRYSRFLKQVPPPLPQKKKGGTGAGYPLYQLSYIPKKRYISK